MSTNVSAEKSSDRRASRQRAFLRAKLSYLDGAVSFDGSVVQISATGAKIALTEDVQLPERFRIEIPQRRIDCVVRVARREELSLAIAFETAESVAEPSHAALLNKIERLETENRALQTKCKALAAQLDNASASY